MLLEPIRLTLYDKKTQEPIKEYQQKVISFAMLTQAVQLQEALSDAPEPVRRWWWQRKISSEEQQIEALLELVVSFFCYQFTVQELREGADVSEVMSVLRAIVARAGRIVTTNPTVPPTRKKHH